MVTKEPTAIRIQNQTKKIGKTIIPYYLIYTK